MITFKEWLLLEAKIDQATKEKIIELWKTCNYTITGIAKLIGVFPSSIKNIVSKVEISDDCKEKINRVGKNKMAAAGAASATDVETVNHIIELWKTCNYTMQDIAQLTKVSPGTVRNIVRKVEISDDCKEKINQVVKGKRVAAGAASGTDAEIVNQIIELWKTCNYTMEDIANRVEIPAGTVRNIVSKVEISDDCKEKINNLRRLRNIEAGRLGGTAVWDKRGNFWEWLKTQPEDMQRSVLFNIAIKRYPNGDDNTVRFYTAMLNKAGLSILE